jgi:hypothetical protein
MRLWLPRPSINGLPFLLFAIFACDAHEGLTDEEAMVARRDGNLSLVRKVNRINASAGEARNDTECSSRLPEWAVWGLLEATAVAVDWTQRGRERWLQQEGAAVQAVSDRRGVAFDVPAYVMNLARRPDRREHSAALLRALGFSRVVFPETISAAELDVQGALAQGWLTPESLRGFDDRVHLRRDSAKRAYIANTIGHLSALRQGVGSGSEVFLVLEDDLLPAAPLLKVRERLQDMLDEIGAAQHEGADMLYLEYCFEACNQTHLHRHRRWHNGVGAPASWLVQAHNPLCSGAIAYTRAGAQRVLEHCVPIFDGIDGMLPALVSNGSLRALAAAPPLFYQDGYWGTDAGRLRGHSAVNFTQDTASAHVTKAQHFIYLSPCILLTDSNMSLIGSNLVNSLRGQEEGGFVDEALTRRIRVPAAAPSLMLNNVQVHGPEQEAYFAARGSKCNADAVGVFYSHSAGTAPCGTGEGGGEGACAQSVSLDPAGFEVPVGAWSLTQDLVLHVPPTSACWRPADNVRVLSMCLLKLVWHSHSGIDLCYQNILMFIKGTAMLGGDEDRGGQEQEEQEQEQEQEQVWNVVGAGGVRGEAISHADSDECIAFVGDSSACSLLPRSSGSATIAIEAMRMAGVSSTELRGMPRDELRDFVSDFVAGDAAPGNAERVDTVATVSGQQQVEGHERLEEPDRPGPAGPWGASSEWVADEVAAEEDHLSWYAATLATLEQVNRHGFHASWRTDLPVDALGIPVLILNHDPSRLAATREQLDAVGLTETEVAATWTAAEGMDLGELQARGLLSPDWHHDREQGITKQRYIAHALDYLAALEEAEARWRGAGGAGGAGRRGKDWGEWVAIVEDDLLLTTSPQVGRERLRAALRELPLDADALYLEWCWDSCRRARFSRERRQVSQTLAPFCVAAVLYSREGVRKLIPQLAPVFSTIDDMVSLACSAGKLNCYKMRQPVFAQDLRWGSAFDAGKGATGGTDLANILMI